MSNQAGTNPVNEQRLNISSNNSKLEAAIQLVLDRGLGLREACRSIYGDEMHVSTLSRHINAKFSPRGTALRNVRSPRLSPVARYWEMENRRSESEIKSGCLIPSPAIFRRGEDIVLYGHRFPTVSTGTDLLFKLECAAVTISQSAFMPPVSIDSYLSPPPLGRWFAGCAADRPSIDPLTCDVVWRERSRTYATGRSVCVEPCNKT